jgi:hypothetical protein
MVCPFADTGAHMTGRETCIGFATAVPRMGHENYEGFFHYDAQAPNGFSTSWRPITKRFRFLRLAETTYW